MVAQRSATLLLNANHGSEQYHATKSRIAKSYVRFDSGEASVMRVSWPIVDGRMELLFLWDQDQPLLLFQKSQATNVTVVPNAKLPIMKQSQRIERRRRRVVSGNGPVRTPDSQFPYSA